MCRDLKDKSTSTFLHEAHCVCSILYYSFILFHIIFVPCMSFLIELNNIKH